MPYRVAKVPGDSRRLVLRPARGLGSTLLIGLGGAATAIGIVLATIEPVALVVALTSATFGGWVASEMLVTRVEIVRDEREGRVVVQWIGAGSKKEALVPLDELRSVVLEHSPSRTARVSIVLSTDERIALTPYQLDESGADEVRRSVSEFLAIGS